MDKCRFDDSNYSVVGPEAKRRGIFFAATYVILCSRQLNTSTSQTRLTISRCGSRQPFVCPRDLSRNRVAQYPGRLVMLCGRARVLARSNRPSRLLNTAIAARSACHLATTG